MSSQFINITDDLISSMFNETITVNDDSIFCSDWLSFLKPQPTVSLNTLCIVIAFLALTFIRSKKE